MRRSAASEMTKSGGHPKPGFGVRDLGFGKRYETGTCSSKLPGETIALIFASDEPCRPPHPAPHRVATLSRRERAGGEGRGTRSQRVGRNAPNLNHARPAQSLHVQGTHEPG